MDTIYIGIWMDVPVQSMTFITHEFAFALLDLIEEELASKINSTDVQEMRRVLLELPIDPDHSKANLDFQKKRLIERCTELLIGEGED